MPAPTLVSDTPRETATESTEPPPADVFDLDFQGTPDLDDLLDPAYLEAVDKLW